MENKQIFFLFILQAFYISKHGIENISMKNISFLGEGFFFNLVCLNIVNWNE